MDPTSRTTFGGPTFLRLLARLTDDALPPGSAAPAERLGQWLDWSRAVALSRVLDAKAPAPAAQAVDGDDAAAVARARATLLASIAEAPELAVPKPQGDAATRHATGTPGPATDFAPLRQRHLALQRAMQAAAGRLRGDLRDRLARRSAAMARLAEVDAVMEGALSPREHALLGAVPALLERRFERLRAAAVASADTPSQSWLDGFRRDMQGVLVAELDVRFQPVEGLLAALRAH